MTRTLTLIPLATLAACAAGPSEMVPVGAFSKVDNNSAADIRMVSPTPSDGSDLPEPDEVGVRCENGADFDANVIDGVLYLAGDDVVGCTVWLRAEAVESLVVRGDGEVRADNDVPLFALESIDVRGGGDVHLGAVRHADLQIVAAGAGEVEITDLLAEDLDVDIRGSGDVTLAGEAEDAWVDISGSGNFDGSELSIGDLYIHVTGSGSADVYVTGSVHADVTGSGTVDVDGGATIEGNLSLGL